MGRYILQFLIAIDQVFNTILFGYADETLSARAWRAEQKGKIFGRIFRPIIDLIMFFQKDHCKLAHEAEIKRRHLPPEMRP
jgi:hypothetical protein